jgi:hypothetical protein
MTFFTYTKGFAFIIIAIAFNISSVMAQQTAEGQPRLKDIGDYISSRNLQPGDDLVMRKLYLPILPIIGYAPANGFVVGAGLAPAILLDSSHHTHLSIALANVQFTSKGQRNINIRHNVYTRKDAFIIQGDWRLLFFTQPTYGLGVVDFPAAFSLNGLSLDQDNGSQPMRFSYLRMQETVFRRVYDRLYAGLGFYLDYHWNIRDERLVLDSANNFYTSHYIYSIAEGFNHERYTTNGFIVRALYDDRDNMVNAFSGFYLDLGIRVNNNFMGSDKNSTQLFFEGRKFLSLSPDNHQLAFWLLGSFLTSGTMPYLALPSIGWDTYNRSGRGFIQGRFRGANSVYAEAEWRFRLSQSGLFGGVIFLNTLTTDNKFIDQKLADRFAFGSGAGLRVKMSKETRTNICIDLGFGSDGSSGLYFGLQEAF